MLPSKNDLVVCCAHAAYQIQEELAARNSGIKSFSVNDRDALPRRPQDQQLGLSPGDDSAVD